jgi:probable phosphoglycerate mutase
MTLWLVRHGATDWSESGRHTGRTDIPLQAEGEASAQALASALAGHVFGLVLTSPLQRARHTAELAGFPDAAPDGDLREWDYGDYEGVTTPSIRESVPGWTVWTHPCPGGESADQVADRLDRVVKRVRSVDGDALVFGHGHSLRALTARWLGEPVAAGRFYRLDTATVSQLGYERDQPVIQAWNVPA